MILMIKNKELIPSPEFIDCFLNDTLGSYPTFDPKEQFLYEVSALSVLTGLQVPYILSLTAEHFREMEGYWTVSFYSNYSLTTGLVYQPNLIRIFKRNLSNYGKLVQPVENSYVNDLVKNHLWKMFKQFPDLVETVQYKGKQAPAYRCIRLVGLRYAGTAYFESDLFQVRYQQGESNFANDFAY